jgi:hypothetical protein
VSGSKDGRPELVNPSTGKSKVLSRRSSGGADEWFVTKTLDGSIWITAGGMDGIPARLIDELLAEEEEEAEEEDDNSSTRVQQLLTDAEAREAELKVKYQKAMDDLALMMRASQNASATIAETAPLPLVGTTAAAACGAGLEDTDAAPTMLGTLPIATAANATGTPPVAAADPKATGTPQGEEAGPPQESGNPQIAAANSAALGTPESAAAMPATHKGQVQHDASTGDGGGADAVAASPVVAKDQCRLKLPVPCFPRRAPANN